MPEMLTLLHDIPFAIMSDKCVAKIRQCQESGEDIMIRIWQPTDPGTVATLGINMRIATVIEENDNAQDD